MKHPESQRVKELRGSETLREFAEKFDVTHSNISAIESDRQGLAVPLGKKIAEYYKVSLDWLYGFSDHIESSDSYPDQATGKFVSEDPLKYGYGINREGWNRLLEEKDKQIELLTSFLKNRELDLADCRNQVSYFKNLYDQSSSSK